MCWEIEWMIDGGTNDAPFFLMKLYYNTDTLRTILKQVYYKKQKQKQNLYYIQYYCLRHYL